MNTPEDLLKKEPALETPSTDTAKKLEQLRTYYSDLSAVLDTKKIPERKSSGPQPSSTQHLTSSPKKGKKIIITTVVVILLIAATLASFAIINLKTNGGNNTPQITGPKASISGEAVKNIVLAPSQSIPEAIASVQKSLNSAPGTITLLNFYTTTQENASGTPLLGKEFANRFDKTVPDTLTQALTNDYTVGLYSNNNKWSPFVIFKTISHENAYIGMQKWEETMGDTLEKYIDLGQSTTSQVFIPVYPLILTPASTSTLSVSIAANQSQSTTTASTSTTISTQNTPGLFYDLTIKNISTRALAGIDGQPVLFYALPTNDTIVITTDQATLEEVLARLLAQKY